LKNQRAFFGWKMKNSRHGRLVRLLPVVACCGNAHGTSGSARGCLVRLLPEHVCGSERATTIVGISELGHALWQRPGGSAWLAARWWRVAHGPAAACGDGREEGGGGDSFLWIATGGRWVSVKELTQRRYCAPFSPLRAGVVQIVYRADPTVV
jgi:hypothetical protein